MRMKIKNIIFDFDGVLVRNTDLLFNIEKDIFRINKKEFEEKFMGNQAQIIFKYPKKTIELF
jgi:phosphoglycolate phosphatase-like HAD superfamily hydrolase